jgi:hypothetical protein
MAEKKSRFQFRLSQLLGGMTLAAFLFAAYRLVRDIVDFWPWPAGLAIVATLVFVADTIVRRRASLRACARAPARCSFCNRDYKEAGPFAEGAKSVFICGPCAAACADLIANERERTRPIPSNVNPEIASRP